MLVDSQIQDVSTMTEAMARMSTIGKTYYPSPDPVVVRFHKAKHEIFLLQHEHQQQYKKLIQEAI